MEQNRIPSNTTRKKPRVILTKKDKRFSFINQLHLGDKRQLVARLTVDSEKLEMAEDGNEYKIATLLITEAELIEEKDKRII